MSADIDALMAEDEDLQDKPPAPCVPDIPAAAAAWLPPSEDAAPPRQSDLGRGPSPVPKRKAEPVGNGGASFAQHENRPPAFDIYRQRRRQKMAHQGAH
uniref:Uncharacterized protein n=1 Tax=Tetraselmis sp. GSL018 TaxID=582737 RepID=A0A061SFN8_9CHLO